MFKPDGRSTTEKGMGPEHRRTRAEWAPIVAAGGVLCSVCKLPIVDGKAPQIRLGKVVMVSTWHLDHNRPRTGYLGPAHAHCNVVKGAREGNRRGNASPKRRGPRRRRRTFAALSTSRPW